MLTLCCCLTNPKMAVGASKHQPGGSSQVETRARAAIESIAAVGFDEFRRRNDSEPRSRQDRAAIVAALPEQGTVVPTKAERITLSALDRVFDRYNRLGAIEIKVVDLEPALVGVHERAVLLVTRRALALVSPRELQAIAAHELAHEYFWKEFEVALNANAFERLQELELICDGVAVITLTSLGIDRRHLINAAAKLTRYNERTAARIMTSRQVSLERRIAFIKEVDRLLGGKTRRYGNGRIGIPAGR